MAKHLRQLRLYEDVMLLALRNDKGTIAGGVMYSQAVGGALLAELILDGRIRAVTEGRKTYAVAERSTSVGDPILDECLQKVVASPRRRTLLHWVQKFAAIKQLKHRVAASLVDRGILREEAGRVLLIFSRRLYPEFDPSAERAIVARLSDAIFSDTATVDTRTTVLIALAQHSGLLKANLDRKQLKARRARIDAIAKGDAVGKATRQAIEAVHAAVMVAVIMPAVIASSSN